MLVLSVNPIVPGAVIVVPFVLPSTPSDVYLQTDGANPNRRGRELQDVRIAVNCVDPRNILIGKGVTGNFIVRISGDADSALIVCDQSNRVIGTFVNDLVEAPTPTKTPTPIKVPRPNKARKPQKAPTPNKWRNPMKTPIWNPLVV